MEKFQKFPNTTGQFVKVQDHSKLDDNSATADETKLDVALEHAVTRVDYNKNTQSLAFNGTTFAKQILVKGTDNKDYLIPAFLWEKPNAPKVTVLNYDNFSSSGYTRTITNTNQAMTIKITGQGDGKVYYKINDGTEAAFPTSKQKDIVPDMASYCQTITVTLYEKYAGQVSDEVTIVLNYWRKLALSLSYTPNSTNGDNGGTAHSTMYYSPSGMVIATTNQIAGDTRVPTWNNEQGNGTNKMMFYTDTPAETYWFQASIDNSSADANDGWVTSDKTYAKALQIRHLHIPVATAENPQINNVSGDANGIYEPHKNLVIAAEESHNTNGGTVALSTSYQISYSNNIYSPGSNQINVNVINEAINAAHTRIYGDVMVTGRIDALAPEHINGTDYYWSGQAFNDLSIQCRHLPKPSIKQDLLSSPNKSGNWVNGVKFTMTAPNYLVDSNGTTPVSENIVYTSGSSSTEYAYSSPIVISGDSYVTKTVAKDTIKAKRKVATWITSDQASAPTNNVVYDKPEVYYGAYDAKKLGFSVFENTSITLTDSQVKSALSQSTVFKYNIEYNPSTPTNVLDFVHMDNVEAIPLESGVGHIVAYPKSWPQTTEFSNGVTKYVGIFNVIEINLKGLDYRVYYRSDLNASHLSENISFLFS